MASTATTVICQAPEPKKWVKMSPISTPIATPSMTSATRRTRWP